MDKKCDDCKRPLVLGETIYEVPSERGEHTAAKLNESFRFESEWDIYYICQDCEDKFNEENQKIEDSLMSDIDEKIGAVRCSGCGKYLGHDGGEDVGVLKFYKGYPDTYWEPGEPSYLYWTCPACAGPYERIDKLLVQLKEIVPEEVVDATARFILQDCGFTDEQINQMEGEDY